jgi:hypothetical protein
VESSSTSDPRLRGARSNASVPHSARYFRSTPINGHRSDWAGWSGSCHNQTHAPQQTSFDHLVGSDNHRWWDCEAERLRSLQIKNELEPGRLHDRQVCRLGTFENLAGIDADLMI